MTIDLTERTKEFCAFYRAFDPATHGESMGRAAEMEAYNYQLLSEEEKEIAVDWFLALFAEERSYYSTTYFTVIAQMNEPRFLPHLRSYYKQLRRKSRKWATMMHPNGKISYIKPKFKIERSICKLVMKQLKRAENRDPRDNLKAVEELLQRHYRKIWGLK